jgi:tripartite-type tricarboxylate transporter receptor subunit TctC
MLRRSLLASLAAGLAIGPARAQADGFPTRPLTLVVPFPPGGSTSVMARIVAETMGEMLGQQVIVDNRPGAGGTIAAKAFVRAPADGYTWLLGYSGTIAIGPSLYPNAGFDPRRDFAPIGLIGSAPAVLVVHPSLGVSSVAELLDLARKKPGSINFGSAGIGTVTHVAGELFTAMAGVKITHVPYRGSGPVMNDLVGGHIPMSFTPIPAAHAQVEGGTLKALGITSTVRSALMPDVPTIAEAGLPGYEAVLHYGLLAPRGTPAPIVDRLNKVLREAIASPIVQKRLAMEGAEPLLSSPAEYAADIDADEAKWAKVLKDAGIKLTE